MMLQSESFAQISFFRVARRMTRRTLQAGFYTPARSQHPHCSSFVLPPCPRLPQFVGYLASLIGNCRLSHFAIFTGTVQSMRKCFLVATASYVSFPPR